MLKGLFNKRQSKEGETTMNAFNPAMKPSNVASDKVTIGRIWKVSEKGWGFIISQEIPFTKIFFHWTYLIRDTLKFTELQKGMFVEFVPADRGENGIHAIKIRVMEESEVPEEVKHEETPVDPITE